MSIRARPEASGPAAAGTTEGSQAPSPPGTADRLLGRLSVLPTLLVLAWLLAGLPLLLAGHFTAVLMLVVSLPLAAVLVTAGLRWIPGTSPGAGLALAGPARMRGTPWWAVAGVIVVALVFGVDQLIYHSQYVIVTRDPGAYLQFANWIAHHGSLPIPQDRAAFGGDHNVLQFYSYANYPVGTSVVLQFMAGLPMVLSTAFWIGGLNLAVAFNAVIGAGAVLTFGGLAARLAGPRWAPLASLVLALTLPEQFTSRSTYSEPLAQLLLLGGLCLLVDALSADGAGARVLAGLSGLALGLTVLVRIDGVGDILPVLPYCGLLFLGRKRQATPFLAGLIVGVAYGLVDGLKLTFPYLRDLRSVLIPVAVVAAALIVATVVAVAVRWKKGVPDLARTWLPNAVAALAVLVVIGFAVRPYVQTTRSPSVNVRAFQIADHLPLDPTREYFELSLHWVFWYVGVPAVILGTIGAALLSRRCLRGEAQAWTLPLAVFAFATVTTLYRPSITPDQPWASRRLVPTVLPAFILLAVWAIGQLSGWLRRARVHELVRVGLPACCVAAMIIPATITTFGLRIHDGGVVAEGLAFKKTRQGQIAAIRHICAAMPKKASVVFIDSVGTDESWLGQAVRGTCNVPVASIASADQSNVAAVVGGIYQAGRRPVLLAGGPRQLAPYGGPVRAVVGLRTTEDAHTLTAPPLTTARFDLSVWMSEPPG